MSKFVTIVRNSIFVAAAFAATASAFAETSPTLAVRYSDLDLSSASGQHRLHSRLVSAAHVVCASNVESGTRIQSAYTTCVSKAMTGADTQFALLTSRSAPQVAVADRH